MFTSKAKSTPPSACRCAKSNSRRQKSYTGAIGQNEPVRVYDCSGPWGDPNLPARPRKACPRLRRNWILKRGDVEEYDGRELKPIDDGYLSEKHRGVRQRGRTKRRIPVARPALPNAKFSRQNRQGRHATCLRPSRHHHAGDGIHRHPRKHGPGQFGIGRLRLTRRHQTQRFRQAACRDRKSAPNAEIATSRPSVFSRFPQRIPAEITPEFVRSEVAAGRAIIPATSIIPNPSR